jgi:hypothetical protein
MPVPARQAGTPAFLVRGAMGAGSSRRPTLALQVRLERFETPSTNIVGVIRGTDPKLRNEYVLYSSHQDHDGVRYLIDGDSVWAGADDNGTGSVALLAAARAFARQPGKRSCSSCTTAPRSAACSVRATTRHIRWCRSPASSRC